MAATTLSPDQLSADPEAAQEAAHRGPVFIRHGDRVGSVLLSVEDHRKLKEKAAALAETLSVPQRTMGFRIPEFD